MEPKESATDPRTPGITPAEAVEANAAAGEAYRRAHAVARVRGAIETARQNAALMERGRASALVQTKLDEALLWLSEVEKPTL